MRANQDYLESKEPSKSVSHDNKENSTLSVAIYTVHFYTIYLLIVGVGSQFPSLEPSSHVRINSFNSLMLSLHYATTNEKFSVPGMRPNFSGSLGHIITEMGISFDLKMLFRFSETFFDFWPRNLVFGPPCSM